jgi:hypothetical protein
MVQVAVVVDQTKASVFLQVPEGFTVAEVVEAGEEAVEMVMARRELLLSLTPHLKEVEEVVEASE